ncbi:hypothetical protein BD408DRAFT_433191 [Parasitella parasitica]|nr:hypothetical protein BD408DRAFT_433191 [Parasitella parasitica]
MSILKLPTEVLMTVFDSIHDVKHLVQYRLVCKAWNKVALWKILSKPIYIYNEEQAKGFCSYLSKNKCFKSQVRNLWVTDFSNLDESQGYYSNEVNQQNNQIKNLGEVEESANKKKDYYKKILSLVFTSKLEVLDGTMDDGCYQLISSLVADYAKKDNDKETFKLKKLPKPSMSNSAAYKDAALLFKGSLNYLKLWISHYMQPCEMNFFESLKSFKCLTSLELNIKGDDFFALKIIVDNCCTLQELDIEYIEDINWSQEAQEWFNEHDTKNTCSLKSLLVSDCFSAAPIEYLVLKYMKIETVLIDMTSYASHAEAERHFNEAEEDANEEGFIENLHLRVIEALNTSTVSSYEMEFYPHHQYNPLDDVASLAKIGGNHAELARSPDDQELMILKVRPCRE